jgi:hypothetical protein
MLKNYRDLKVWQKSYGLCLDLYRITKKFPKEERYGLTSQIRRSAVSIPCKYRRRIWQEDNGRLLEIIDKIVGVQTLEQTLGPLTP